MHKELKLDLLHEMKFQDCSKSKIKLNYLNIQQPRIDLRARKAQELLHLIVVAMIINSLSEVIQIRSIVKLQLLDFCS